MNRCVCSENMVVLTGNPKKHISALKKAVDTPCAGEPSLYNSLNLAMQTLKYVGFSPVLVCDSRSWCLTVYSAHISFSGWSCKSEFYWVWVLLFSCRHMPGHTSREVLIIFSSLTTCDPANIYELIKVSALSVFHLKGCAVKATESLWRELGFG